MKDIEKYVSKGENADVYLFDPKAMKRETVKNLKRDGFKVRDIHHDSFHKYR